MTHYLRNSKNKTIVDIDGSKNDFHVFIDIENYSEMLLLLSFEKQKEFISGMGQIQELRSYWHEDINKKDKFVNKFISDVLISFAKEWNLVYITD